MANENCTTRLQSRSRWFRIDVVFRKGNVNLTHCSYAINLINRRKNNDPSHSQLVNGWVGEGWGGGQLLFLSSGWETSPLGTAPMPMSTNSHTYTRKTRDPHTTSHPLGDIITHCLNEMTLRNMQLFYRLDLKWKKKKEELRAFLRS